MPQVVDIEVLQAEGWLSGEQAREIARRSRDTMVTLAINAVLITGILIATTGLIYWLAVPAAVALVGTGFLAMGIFILMKGNLDFRMLGNAAAVIGGGMLIGGLSVELLENFGDIADPIMMLTGAAVIGVSLLAVLKGPAKVRFASGSLLILGLAMHVTGVGNALDAVADWWRVPAFLYAALLIAGAGVLLDVRLVTAAAAPLIVGMLAVGEDVFDIEYLVVSPESTLNILLLSAVAALALVWSRGRPTRLARHGVTIATLTLVFVNISFLYASWNGDGVGQIFLERPVWNDAAALAENRAKFDAYDRGLLFIDREVFILAWALVLAVTAFWAARRNRRGLFNTAIAFGAIHFFSQVMEHYFDDPAAWALIGLALIPLAWGMWKANRVMSERVPA